MTWDLNCDLGEGEAPGRTARLMQSITSANIACGGHAGDLASMRRSCELGVKFGVRLGAHPGPWDRAGFGRQPVTLSPAELELLLLHQVGALQKLAHEAGARLHHVKLHGGLYHAVEGSDRLARAYVELVHRHWTGLKIYARAGGRVWAWGRKGGVTVWGEAFVDRGYRADGSLVPRTEPGALIESGPAVRARLEDLVIRRQVTSGEGQPLPVAWRTLCVHGDTPTATRVARWARAYLAKR